MSSRRQEELVRAARFRVLALPPVLELRPTCAPGACTTTGWRPANTRSARWPSSRSSCAAFSTTRPGWKTAASWTSCTASRARRWPCATSSVKPRLADLALVAGEDDIDTTRLFDQIVVDKARLRSAVQHALRRQPQITLRELLDAAPLHQGLAELVAYLELAHAADGGYALEGLRALVDEAVEEPIRWQALNAAGEAVTREARMPRVIFTR
jgi:hypothetical protein